MLTPKGSLRLATILMGLALTFPIDGRAQKVELVVQTGHIGDINSVKFSPDGKLLASGGEDRTVKLWNVGTGQQIRSLNGHTDLVFTVAFSPDGKTLASGSRDKTIKLWNVETGREIRVLSGQDSYVYSVAFSLDGRTLFSVGKDEVVTLWNVRTGQKIRSLASHPSITLAPDGKSFACGSDGGMIELWNLRSGHKFKSFRGFSDRVDSIDFSPDGKILTARGYDGNVQKTKLWNSARGREIKSLEDQLSGVYRTAFSPDGKTFAAAFGDRVIKLFNIESGQLIESLSGSITTANSIEFSPDGKTLAEASDAKAILMWNVETGDLRKPLTGSIAGVNSIQFSPDGKTLASGNDDRIIKLWNTETGHSIRSLTSHEEAVLSLTFSRNGKVLVSGADDGGIKFWNVETGEVIKSLANDGMVLRVAISPDGNMLVTSGGDAAVTLWNVETGQPIGTLEGHSDLVTSAAFSPDGKSLVSVCRNGSFKIWNVENQKEVKSFAGQNSNVEAVAFSPDGKTLALGNTRAALNLVDIETGRTLKTLIGHTADIWSLAFSPDGKTLASGSRDATIKLWNVGTGQEIATLGGHSAEVAAIAFSPDGNFIVSGSLDGTTKLWSRKTNQLLASLVSLGANDWLVTTPEGYFDGTPNGWKQLLWRFNDNTFDYSSVETYFNDFFYPNLLQDVLAGRSPEPKAGRELEKIDRRQPKVEIVFIDGPAKSPTGERSQIDKRITSISVSATENIERPKQMSHHPSSEVRDLRLFRNGSLVKIWHGETIDEIVKNNKADCRVEPAAPGEARKLVCRTRVQIMAGDNRFGAYAFNSSNVKTNDDSISIDGADSLKREGTLYVLAVGVNRYANSAYDLNFAVADVEEISLAIKGQQDKLSADAGFKQYAKTEIITLTDENAAKENILLALRRFSRDERAGIPGNSTETLRTELTKIKPTQPEDALIIYYAGHGASREQRFYLLPHDFQGKDAESIARQGISDVEINEALEEVDAGRFLMVIDACQSGQALGGQNEGRAPMNSKGLAQLAYDKGILILTAAQSQQSALEAVRIGNKEVRHGLLTYALLRGLADDEADKDNNGQLSEREWLDYAVSRVPKLQLEAMNQRHIEIAQNGQRKAELLFVNGDDKNADPTRRKLQTPRVFYRQEAESNPLVVSRP